MDSFSLYCLATEIEPARMQHMLGLIEARLLSRPDKADDRLYKGALLARIGAGQSVLSNIVAALVLYRARLPTNIRIGEQDAGF